MGISIIEQRSHRSGGPSRSLDPIQDGLPGLAGHMDDGWNHQVRRDGFERAQVMEQSRLDQGRLLGSVSGNVPLQTCSGFGRNIRGDLGCARHRNTSNPTAKQKTRRFRRFYEIAAGIPKRIGYFW
jgi:hypothetical protein